MIVTCRYAGDMSAVPVRIVGSSFAREIYARGYARGHERVVRNIYARINNCYGNARTVNRLARWGGQISHLVGPRSRFDVARHEGLSVERDVFNVRAGGQLSYLSRRKLYREGINVGVVPSHGAVASRHGRPERARRLAGRLNYYGKLTRSAFIDDALKIA